MAAGQTDPATLALEDQVPEELRNHISERDIILLAMSPEDFSKEHSGTAFDFRSLLTEFYTMIPTARKITLGKPCYSIHFASKIIYDVGPASRSVKRPDNDKKWKFIIESNDKKEASCIYVSTFKSSVAPVDQPTIKNNILKLTIKQAGLLALTILNNVVNVLVGQDLFLITPLAGAVFSKNDINKLSKEYNSIFKTKLTNKDIMNMVNSSCQSGGQYLTDSKCSIAAICSIVATRNMNNKRERESIVGKTVKQYINVKKDMSIDEFRLFAAYAFGGVPEEFSAPKLIENFSQLQISMVRMNAILKNENDLMRSTSGMFLNKDAEENVIGETSTSSKPGGDEVKITYIDLFRLLPSQEEIEQFDDSTLESEVVLQYFENFGMDIIRIPDYDLPDIFPEYVHLNCKFNKNTELETSPALKYNKFLKALKLIPTEDDIRIIDLLVEDSLFMSTSIYNLIFKTCKGIITTVFSGSVPKLLIFIALRVKLTNDFMNNLFNFIHRMPKNIERMYLNHYYRELINLRDIFKSLTKGNIISK